MTWTSESDFKTWDFICLDPQQMPVAKFSANMWAWKKIGKVEFLKPANEQAREEIVVMGNILSVFGAIFAKPAHQEKMCRQLCQSGVPMERMMKTPLLGRYSSRPPSVAFQKLP